MSDGDVCFATPATSKSSNYDSSYNHYSAKNHKKTNDSTYFSLRFSHSPFYALDTFKLYCFLHTQSLLPKCLGLFPPLTGLSRVTVNEAVENHERPCSTLRSIKLNSFTPYVWKSHIQ